MNILPAIPPPTRATPPAATAATLPKLINISMSMEGEGMIWLR